MWQLRENVENALKVLLRCIYNFSVLSDDYVERRMEQNKNKILFGDNTKCCWFIVPQQFRFRRSFS